MDKTQPIKSLIIRFERLYKIFLNIISENKDFVELLEAGMEPDYNVAFVKEYFKKRRENNKNLSDCLQDIQKQSINESYYFFDCPFIVYKETLNNRLEEFLDSFSEATPIDFYKAELNQLNKPGSNRYLYVNNEKKINYSRFIGTNTLNFKYSLDKKVNYIKLLINSQIPETTSINKNKTKEFYSHPIFKNNTGEELFNFLVEKLLINVEEIKYRSNQSKFIAIWEVAKKQEIIFKTVTNLKEYIEFLNSIYSTNYNSRSKSKGDKYQIEVKNLIELYNSI